MIGKISTLTVVKGVKIHQTWEGTTLMIQTDDDFSREIIREMTSVLLKYLSWENHLLSFSLIEADVFAFAEEILNDKLLYDIERFVNSDPAATNASDPLRYVVKSYKGMRAIIHYRIANHLLYKNDIFLSTEEVYRDPFDDDTTSYIEATNYFYLLARKISEDAAIETSVEINPSAKIGKGLVIDHGYSTKILSDTADKHGIVVGETCEIGENCTILNGVIIGASTVNKGYSTGRRHPKIGSNVTICANSRILGAIDIGDNVVIAPYAVVTHNVPSDCRVSIVNQLQIERVMDPSEKFTIYGLMPSDENYVLFGDNLDGCNVCLCVSENLVDELPVNIVKIENSRIIFSIDSENFQSDYLSVCIFKGSTRIYLLQSSINKNQASRKKNEGEHNG